MKCECCGREKKVLVEIGAVSPKSETTGKCCQQCCMFILASLEDEREESVNRKAEFLPVDEEQAFTDGRGYPVGKEKVRFGLKLIERLGQLETDDDVFPEYEVECIRNLIGEY